MGYRRLLIFTYFIAVTFRIPSIAGLSTLAGSPSEAYTFIDLIFNSQAGIADEQHLPTASGVQKFPPDSQLVKDLRFHAELCLTVNCRDSLRNWDCDLCLKVLPDGEVIKDFKTYPNDITGQIVRSKARKTVYVQIRGATSTKNKLLYYHNNLVPYPAVPGAFVHRGCFVGFSEMNQTMISTITDQIALYPDYRIHVIGHSFGGCMASLAALELLQRVKNVTTSNLSLYTMGKPRVGNQAFVLYHDSTGIDHKRIVSKADSVVHQPGITSGYLHEGVEHWVFDDALNTRKCVGGESRSCSNSLIRRTMADHLSYYGTYEGCAPGQYAIS